MTAMPDDPDLLKAMEEVGLTESAPAPEKPKQPKLLIEPPVSDPLLKKVVLVNTPSVVQDDELPDSGSNLNVGEMYDTAAQKLMENYNADRSELTQYINSLIGKINESEMPVRIYYETLANLIRTKTESNTTLIKLLENLGRKLEKGSNGADALKELLNE